MWHFEGMVNRVQFSQLYIHNIKYLKKLIWGKINYMLRKFSAVFFDGLIKKSVIIQKLIKALLWG